MTMVAQIPVISEKPLAACGCRKFQLDVIGDHLCTCTDHSGVKKVHDWTVDQLTDLFRTTHHTKTQHVTKSRGRHCGDMQLESYLANVVGPMLLVVDLRIAHDRFGSSSDPSLVSFIPAIPSTSGKLHSEFIRLLFLQSHRETDRFFAASGVHLVQSSSGLFHFRRAAFLVTLKANVGSTLAKATYHTKY
jgi:hypothetical protein